MKLEEFLKQYTAEYNRDEAKVRLFLSFKKFEKLLGELEKAGNWMEDGKTWRSLNVMTMIGVEETLKGVKEWFSERVALCETPGIKYKFKCCSGKDLDELAEILGVKTCPNCGKTVSQLELEENRGVCGLCYESLSSNSPQKILGVESS